MQPTQYADVNALLATLLSNMQRILGNKLVGLYLYGSLVWGDFDYDISDIDMLVATASDIDDREFAALHAMHDDIAFQSQKWSDRIETQYFSLHGLQTFKSQSTNMGNISPGEPFHIIRAGKEWSMNWYFVQEYGVTLFGPSPRTFIDPISNDEFREAVRDHAIFWREYIVKAKDSRPYQSYAILTMCRALYTTINEQQTSKLQAALWAEKQFPEWSPLIQDALVWRKDHRSVQHEATYPETAKFVHFMIDQIEGA